MKQEQLETTFARAKEFAGTVFDIVDSDEEAAPAVPPQSVPAPAQPEPVPEAVEALGPPAQTKPSAGEGPLPDTVPEAVSVEDAVLLEAELFGPGPLGIAAVEDAQREAELETQALEPAVVWSGTARPSEAALVPGEAPPALLSGRSSSSLSIFSSASTMEDGSGLTVVPPPR